MLCGKNWSRSRSRLIITAAPNEANKTLIATGIQILGHPGIRARGVDTRTATINPMTSPRVPAIILEAGTSFIALRTLRMGTITRYGANNPPTRTPVTTPARPPGMKPGDPSVVLSDSPACQPAKPSNTIPVNLDRILDTIKMLPRYHSSPPTEK